MIPTTPTLPENPALITRREAVLRVSALLGGTLVGGQALLTACANVDARRPVAERARSSAAERARGGAAAAVGGFAASDVELLDEIAETILPDTTTPGAKAAGVGPFIALMVTDVYDADEQRTFREGMRTLDDECRRAHGAAFVAAMPAQRLALLERLDREQMQYMRTRGPGSPPHYFRMMKELALLGYFTSEIGYTQAMRYVEAPGRFEPCVAYTPGETTWAPHA